jgi:hypothetical protein
MFHLVNMFLFLSVSGLCAYEIATVDQNIEKNNKKINVDIGSYSEGICPGESVSMGNACRTEEKKFYFSGVIKATGTFSWPIFEGNNDFILQVNERMCKKVNGEFYQFIEEILEEEKSGPEFDQEALDLEFNQRDYGYRFIPVYVTSKFVSVFGVSDRYNGAPHGRSRYHCLNFYMIDDKIKELSIQDLFDPEIDAIFFLLQYCFQILTKNHVGYFHSDEIGNLLVELKATDLEIFTLSNQGLTITFQPYHVGGWADGPYSVNIPLDALKEFILPDGVISRIFINNGS